MRLIKGANSSTHIFILYFKMAPIQERKKKKFKAAHVLHDIIRIAIDA